MIVLNREGYNGTDVLELLKKCRTSKQRQWFQERLEPETFETAQKIRAGVQI